MAFVSARQVDASAEDDVEVLRDLSLLEEHRPRAKALDARVPQKTLAACCRQRGQKRDFVGQCLKAAGAICRRDDFREVVHARALFVTNWPKEQLLRG